MAHPEVGIWREPKAPVRFLLNIFPKPAKAKLISVRMISFFINIQVTKLWLTDPWVGARTLLLLKIEVFWPMEDFSRAVRLLMTKYR